MENQDTEHSPWYHITPFSVMLRSGWIMAFQRTECALGPNWRSDGMDLKWGRHTRVRTEPVTDPMVIPGLGIYPASLGANPWWRQLRVQVNHSVSTKSCVSRLSGSSAAPSRFHLGIETRGGGGGQSRQVLMMLSHRQKVCLTSTHWMDTEVKFFAFISNAMIIFLRAESLHTVFMISLS